MDQDLQQIRQLDERVDRVCKAFGPDTEFEPNGSNGAVRHPSSFRFKAFLKSGLAVICGPKSNNLIVLGFRLTDVFNRFIHDNPILKNTFSTHREDERLLFFRSTDFVPASSNDDG